MTVAHSLRDERIQASRQFRDGAFRNTSGARPDLKGNHWPVLGEFFFGGSKRVPRSPLPLENPLPTWTQQVSSRLRMTWLGHSTLLLEIDGMKVLTDPVFGERASPVSFAGPKRFHPVPVKLAELPELDAVLLSHDHHDHLCPSSIKELAKRRVPIVTSLGVGKHLERLGVESSHIVELDWWETHVLPGGELSFTATPAQHFSGRGLTDRNSTLWSSWVLKTARQQLFFSGDTGLTEEFREIHRRFGHFDATLLEIGAWHPAWGDIHLGPENAVRAFEMLGGGTLVPVHWGTFDLALHAWDEPAETLVRVASERQARVLTPLLGRPFEPAHLEGPTPWWRRAEGVPRSAAALVGA